MLAKDLKIAHLILQRKYILNQLSQTKADGNCAYFYQGQLFKENKAYFESEGFIIDFVPDQGLPQYLFTVKDMDLSDEDMLKLGTFEPSEAERIYNQLQQMCERMETFNTESTF